MREIVVIAHDIRSCHNIGSLLRTADGFGVRTVYLTGHSPYPKRNNDTRLPHIAERATRQIHKTALGAEARTDLWEHVDNVGVLIQQLQKDGFEILALEQNTKAIPLPDYKPPLKVVIILGREVEGLAVEIQDMCDSIVEIPMFGQKESLNVTEAATAAIYHCRFAAE